MCGAPRPQGLSWGAALNPLWVSDCAAVGNGGLSVDDESEEEDEEEEEEEDDDKEEEEDESEKEEEMKLKKMEEQKAQSNKVG